MTFEEAVYVTVVVPPEELLELLDELLEELLEELEEELLEDELLLDDELLEVPSHTPKFVYQPQPVQ
jgi:hypothetical protein